MFSSTLTGSNAALFSRLAGRLPADLPHRELFAERLRRYLPDLAAGLSAVYSRDASGGDESGGNASGGGANHVGALSLSLERLMPILLRHHAERHDDLRRLDLERSLAPDWFQRPDTIAYVCYTERFAGTLRGVQDRLDYLAELGVTYLHLMPFLQTRPAPHDGGYAVADFRAVRQDLGTMADLEALTGALHARGMSLCCDLVLNHVAFEHDWAARARAGEGVFQNYFHLFADRALPDAYEQTLPEVFPDFAPGNFTWDAASSRWVWTTFNSWQWDLNWSNPDVFLEFADLILWLANKGIDIFRLDAIAFIWKRMGTNCQNLPEVHAITQALRAVARIVAPAVVFKAEAIVAPDDLAAYLGTGEHYGKVSDTAYHNSLMVQIWSGLAARDATLMTRALQAFPDKPATTAWGTYLRCHDDIGWAIADDDAHSVGFNGAAHRRFLSDFYAGTFPGSWARGVVFQENARTGDRRISGSAASLAGLEAALESGDEHQQRLALCRLLLGYALVLGFGGVPLLYMGDEIAQLNDRRYLAEPEHAMDNRWIHRPPLDWERVAQAQREPHSLAGRMYHGLRRLIAARSATPQLHAAIPSRVLPVRNGRVFAYERSHPLGNLLGLYNFSEDYQAFPADVLMQRGLTRPFDRISRMEISIADGVVSLEPYASLWLTC